MRWCPPFSVEFAPYHTMKLPSATFQFECVACGKCCSRPGYVTFSEDEIAAAAAFLGMPLEALFSAYDLAIDDEGLVALVTEEAPCPFLKDSLCSIHAVKPEQCRTYPFWPELLTDLVTWQAEAKHCPGIGQGRAYTRKEVRALMQGHGSTEEPSET